MIKPAPRSRWTGDDRSSAKPQLAAAQVNLDYTNIISPVNGTVVSRNVTMGQTVAATFQTPTLFLIATDLTKMEVDTNVSESDIGVIKEGNTARFTVDAFPNRMFQGTVAQVRQSPQTVQNVVTYDVVVSADNSDLALKPGMTASVQLIIAERGDVIRVPDQALRFNPTSEKAAPDDGACASTALAASEWPAGAGPRSLPGWTTTAIPRSSRAKCNPAIRSSLANNMDLHRGPLCPHRGSSQAGQ